MYTKIDDRIIFAVNIDTADMRHRRASDANAFDKMCNRFKERFDDNASA